MLDFLNQNSGAIQGLAATVQAVLVGVTIAYVIIIYKTLGEMRKQTGPYIKLDCAVTSAYEPASLALVVANLGLRNAAKIAFRVLEETGSLSDGTDAPVQLGGHELFHRELGVLPAQREMAIPTPGKWRDIFGNIPGGSVQQRLWRLRYEVKYRDGGRLIKDEGELNYTYLLGLGTRFVQPVDYKGKFSLH